MASQYTRTITPNEDVSYRATSYLMPAGNGYPLLVVNATDPLDWIQEQGKLRDPDPRVKEIEDSYNETRKKMREVIEGIKSSGLEKERVDDILSGRVIDRSLERAKTATQNAVSNLNPVSNIENWIKGGAVSIVIILAGLLVGAFGLYQLSKD